MTWIQGPHDVGATQVPKVPRRRSNLPRSMGCAVVALTHGHKIGVDIQRSRDIDDTHAIVSFQELQNPCNLPGHRGV